MANEERKIQEPPQSAIADEELKIQEQTKSATAKDELYIEYRRIKKSCLKPEVQSV